MMDVLIETLMRELAIGVLGVDRNRRIRLANPTAARLLGCRDGELTGRALIEASLSYEMLSLLTEVQNGASSVQRELRKSETTGKTLRVNVVSVPEDGTVPCRFLILMEDVTELRRLETVRRDFVANVSHELRTPLASIRAMAETLQDGAVNDAAVSSRFMEIIVGEVERLTRLLEDLLILSRAESSLPDKQAFSLNTLIESAIERFQQQAERAGVRIEPFLLPLNVVANKDQIDQVIVNLLDNAVKYTPAGGKIEVHAHRTSNEAVVNVKDTGIGVLNQDLPRLWERFYRADKARTRESGGTGLGLAIVKHIVEIHGGTVSVESEYGKGSVFTFTLPC